MDTLPNESRKRKLAFITERVPGTYGEIPRPLGRNKRRSLLGPPLAWGTDTVHSVPVLIFLTRNLTMHTFRNTVHDQF